MKLYVDLLRLLSVLLGCGVFPCLGMRLAVEDSECFFSVWFVRLMISGCLLTTRSYLGHAGGISVLFLILVLVFAQSRRSAGRSGSSRLNDWRSASRSSGCLFLWYLYYPETLGLWFFGLRICNVV
ncbi:hypothetical protein M9H77_03163 [Catharanthus roseus]|uniref:Uncharacterized protein n=1 Tax=Catharanthus roseus TaxID=4058 RepID=A0ACC0CAG9_CATRO|nr:hypothetical protein M9H77_03163 [Catharanthus roseus]